MDQLTDSPDPYRHRLYIQQCCNLKLYFLWRDVLKLYCFPLDILDTHIRVNWDWQQMQIDGAESASVCSCSWLTPYWGAQTRQSAQSTPKQGPLINPSHFLCIAHIYKSQFASSGWTRCHIQWGVLPRMDRRAINVTMSQQQNNKIFSTLMRKDCV